MSQKEGNGKKWMLTGESSLQNNKTEKQKHKFGETIKKLRNKAHGMEWKSLKVTGMGRGKNDVK